MKMVDGGEIDDKLIAVNDVEPRLRGIKGLDDIDKNKLDEIVNFFERYKELEKKEVKVKGFGDGEEAKRVLEECKNLYIKHKKEIEGGSFNKKDLIKIMGRG